MRESDLPLIGKPLDRADGPLKVTGKACYTAEFPVENLAYAVPVGTSVVAGKIRAIDATQAEQSPGVLAVFSHLHPMDWKDSDAFSEDEQKRGSGSMSFRPLATPDVLYNGQYAALVVAETLEQATHAASLVRVTVEADENPELSFTGNLSKAEVPEEVQGQPPVRDKGEAEEVFATAEVQVDALYSTPWEAHNPIEPHATIAAWDGDKLTVYDATQGVMELRGMLAMAFDTPKENIRVITRFVGGAFGCKGLAWPHVPLAVAAARTLKRPVKLVITRQEMFHNVGYRSPTLQQVQLGAKADGTLVSLSHTGHSIGAIRDVFVEPFTKPSAVMYAADNIHLGQKTVRLNVCRPTFMRAPGETPGMYALECAMDELAQRLGIDPVELRLKNHADKEPLNGLPFSAKSLKQCYAAGAEKFGWDQRNRQPGAMRKNGMLIGHGMASSTYPVNRSGACVRLDLREDGTAMAGSSTHDLGTGSYTVMAQLLAELLGVPASRVRFELGDSAFPEGPMSGGSQTVNSIGSAVKAAVEKLREALAEIAVTSPDSPLFGALPNQVRIAEGQLVVGEAGGPTSEPLEAVLKRAGLKHLEVTGEGKPGDEEKKLAMHSFGAHFCEVQVDPDLGMIRVSRWVAAHACGRILNRKTADSQIRGGVVMGLGMALMEEVYRDERSGRVITSDLASYLVPVHADVPPIESLFIEEEDLGANPIGTKGVGEIGITGVAAAIANAVFNATGIRVRGLPLTPDKLLKHLP